MNANVTSRLRSLSSSSRSITLPTSRSTEPISRTLHHSHYHQHVSHATKSTTISAPPFLKTLRSIHLTPLNYSPTCSFQNKGIQALKINANRATKNYKNHRSMSSAGPAGDPVRGKGPISWTMLGVVGVAAAAAVAYYRVERERRLEKALGQIVSFSSLFIIS